MPIQFVLLVNKQGQTRLAQYSNWFSIAERTSLEGEVVRKCLQRKESECNFVEHLQYKLVYRRYASLFFIVGVDNDENELAVLEFIHCLVETFDKYFENVCELDVMFNVEKAHFILEEMMANGAVVETNRMNVMQPLILMDKERK
jgi:AP-4 complex subunit sigma-1